MKGIITKRDVYKMTKYGYVSRSITTPVTEQLERLVSYQCDNYFIEDNGIDKNSELETLLGLLKKDDIVVVDSLQVIWRPRLSMKEILDTFVDLNIRLISILEDIDTSSERDRMLIKHLVMFHNESEKHSKKISKFVYVQKTKEGAKYGRPKIKKDLVEKIIYLSEEKKMSMRSISEECGVSLGTVYKYISNNREKQ